MKSLTNTIKTHYKSFKCPVIMSISDFFPGPRAKTVRLPASIWVRPASRTIYDNTPWSDALLPRAISSSSVCIFTTTYGEEKLIHIL